MLTCNGRETGMLRRSHGFTLIELMVVVTVVAVGAAIAAPSMRQEIANFGVRSAAESVVNGLNLARAEAVRRNASVTFTLDSAGTGWTVSLVSPSTTIQRRQGSDGGGLAVSSSNASQAVTFLPTGLVNTGATRLEQVTVSSSVSGTQSRQIRIQGGGMVRMCDPAATASNDPRGCS
jgi:type IV fimbrial biogenesis protein FimT